MLRMPYIIGVLVLCVAGAAGCGSPSPPTAKGRALASASSQPGASPSAPTGQRLWTFQAEHHASVAATPDGYVLAGQHDIFGLGADGAQRWHQTRDGDVTVTVAGSTMIVSRKNPAREQWPGSLIVKAFDTTSGQPLWSDDQPSFITTLATAVYTSVCQGGQNNHVGDCRLSARDPRTGNRRWTIGTYASSSVVTPRTDRPYGDAAAPPVPPYLVIVSYPTGFASQTYTSVDPGSGRGLGTSIQSRSVSYTNSHLIEKNNEEHHKEQGCKVTLAAWGPRGGGVIWRQTLTSETDAKGECLGINDKATDGELAVADVSGKTTLVNLATGKTDWTASEPGLPLLIDRDRLITTTAEGGVTSYDRATNSVRWRTGGLTSGTSRPGLGVRVLDKWLLVYDPDADTYCGAACPTVSVLDPATGSLYRAPRGSLIATGSGIVITETDTGGQTSDYHAYSIQ